MSVKNTFGNHLTVTLFGESHGPAVGVVIDGITPGLPVDEQEIARMLTLRRPDGILSTARKEADPFQLVSGVYQGRTTGTPLTVLIPNSDTKSGDYASLANKPRPGHADYSAREKYHGYNDPRGGGHFSGRITAGLVAAGGILIPALRKKGITVGTHILCCGGIDDCGFSPDTTAETLIKLSDMSFPVLDASAGEEMKNAIIQAKNDCDSIGGVLETMILGLPAGLGEPWFDSVEGMLSHAMFSLGGVKGIEFGDGFAMTDMLGSVANDPYRVVDGRIVTETNHNGGINGGITNGMPVTFRLAVKPTPSIAKEQKTVDLAAGENCDIAVTGRHDPFIAARARIAVDSLCAIVVADMLIGRYGTDWLLASDQ